jgi:hypothetical protein
MCEETVLNAEQVRDLLRERLKEVGGKHGALAAAIDVSDAYLSTVLSGKQIPGPRLSKWLGLERVTVWRKPSAAPVDRTSVNA